MSDCLPPPRPWQTLMRMSGNFTIAFNGNAITYVVYNRHLSSLTSKRALHKKPVVNELWEEDHAGSFFEKSKELI
jgi:hypothetical protein